jgi:hypothetical protein
MTCACAAWEFAAKTHLLKLQRERALNKLQDSEAAATHLLGGSIK